MLKHHFGHEIFGKLVNMMLAMSEKQEFERDIVQCGLAPRCWANQVLPAECPAQSSDAFSLPAHFASTHLLQIALEGFLSDSMLSAAEASLGRRCMACPSSKPGSRWHISESCF